MENGKWKIGCKINQDQDGLDTTEEEDKTRDGFCITEME
jgi:hypothetical protein